VVDEVDPINSPDPAATVAVSGNGGFVRFDADIPDAFFTDPWEQLVGTCEVTTTTVTDPFQGLPFPDVGLTFLEAGAAVDVTSSGAPYLELDRNEFTLGGDTIIGYETADDLAGSLNASLAADVPGDEFPAVTNAEFPDVASFSLTAPADPGSTGSVGVDTTFEWTGTSADANTIVMIDFSTTDFVTTTYVTCYAEDTGSFALPDETKTELGAGFTGSVDQASRESIRVETVGDARLLLTVSRSESFFPPILIPIP